MRIPCSKVGIELVVLYWRHWDMKNAIERFIARCQDRVCVDHDLDWHML